MLLLNPPSSSGRRRALWRRSCCLGAALLGMLLPAAPAEVLFDNFSRPQDGLERVTSTRWLASKVLTGDRTLVVTELVLRLQSLIPGEVEAAIYTDSNGRPGQLVAVLNRTGRVPLAFPGPVSFLAGGVQTTAASATREGTFSLSSFLGRMGGGGDLDLGSLLEGTVSVAGTETGLEVAPNSAVWVVTRARGGRFASAYTDDEIGQGTGYSPIWALSTNAGATWSVRSLSPLFLSLNAEALTLEFRTDVEAILSTLFSGLPTAMVQRELVFRSERTLVRDINERLFRHRAALLPEGQPYEIFASGDFGFGDVEQLYPLNGFQSEIYSETVGVEVRPTRHLAFGAAVSGTQGKFSFGANNGGTRVDGVGVSAYAAYATPRFYVDALYSFGSFGHSLRRDTLFGEMATADPRSHNHVLQGNAGYQFHLHGFVTGPFAGVDYVKGDLDGYREQGGGTASLEVPGQNFDSLASEFGWQVSRPLDLSPGVRLIPQLRLSWRHEYLDQAETVHARLRTSPFSLGSGENFTPIGEFAADLRTRRPAEDYFTGGVGLALTLGERWSAFCNYQVTAGNNELAHLLSFTGAVRF